MKKSLWALVSLALTGLAFTGCESGGVVPTFSVGNVSTVLLNFPSQITGTTSAAQIVTLSNSGTAPLSIPSITITGTGSANFSETTTCGATLAPSTTCTTSVTFRPLSAASFAASLSISDNAFVPAPPVNLNGTGVTPQATLTQTSLSFVGTPVSTTSATQTVTLSNPGTAALTVTGIAVTGASPASFAETTTCGAMLAVNATCAISATFRPLSAGSLAATISIADNAPGSPQTVSLTGTGLAPQAMLTQTSLSFPSMTVSNTSDAQTVTLSNPGNATLNIGGITLAGVNPTDFAETTTCGTTLAVNATCTISAAFTPLSGGTTSQSLAGRFAATISIADNAIGPVQAISLAGTGVISIPESYFGLGINNTIHVPTIKFGLERFWDTSATQWPAVELSQGVYTWTTLDAQLAQDYAQNSQMQAFYTLNRTPPWYTTAAQQTTGAACNYYNTGQQTTGAGAPGQCYPPTLYNGAIVLNPDGTGSDQAWKGWVTAIASHANDPTYLKSHTHIRYWELWNEFDRATVIGTYGNNATWDGTYAQMLRMAEDTRCIITGKGTIHNTNIVGDATPCAAMPIDPTALMVSPSSHAQGGVGLPVVQGLFYCTGPGGISSGLHAGAPDYCSIPAGQSWGADAFDIVNFHMKPGQKADGYSEEVEMASEYNQIEGSTGPLQPAEQVKPLWDGESGYTGVSGNAWNANSGAMPLGSYPALQAAFVGRYLLTQWSLGISSFSWYDWDLSNTLSGASGAIAGTTEAGTAYNEMYNWMVGETMTTPCAAVGTQWTCGFTGPNGYQSEAIYDTAYTCTTSADSSCVTTTVFVPSTWTYYRDLTGAENPVSGTVQVGIRPILLENKKLILP